jgi:choline dehydrogenase-like flavoprotein
MVGCAYDAKKGAHLNYLPKAVAAGARIHTDVRIERIAPLAGGGFRARGFVVQRGPRTPRLPYEVRAERVVLAAGAVHSPAILHASGLGQGLPALGRHVSLQPQLAVAGVFPEDVPIVPWRGIPQATFCSQFDDNTPEHGLGGFRFEAISVGMAQLAASFGGFGRSQKQFMAGLGHTGAALLLVPDRPSGRMRWSLGERGFAPRIEYAMTHDWVTRLRRGLRATAEAWLAAGAREIHTSSDAFAPIRGRADLDRALAFPVRTGVTRFISAHVQGSCRMGTDPRTSVVDLEHRVHGAPGLYVVDASVFPTSASTHTMIPIMTFAERAARRMLAAA